MRLIKPSFEILEQEPGLEGIYKQIEIAGRTCYKSEDKITEKSALKFVEMLCKSNHGAMLEHGTVYLWVPAIGSVDIQSLRSNYTKNPYSKCIPYYPFNKGLEGLYITTNYRVLIENNWLDDLKYLCEPTRKHERRFTVRFICDRGVSHEFVRHRVFSFAQESTRFCNYSKYKKFNNELTFIQPHWYKVENLNEYNRIISGKNWISAEIPDEVNKTGMFNTYLDEVEMMYVELINLGTKPQDARAVLPNAIKTELVMTGFVSDWKHFFELRCNSSAHPQARELAIPLNLEFIKRNYV